VKSNLLPTRKFHLPLPIILAHVNKKEQRNRIAPFMYDQTVIGRPDTEPLEVVVKEQRKKRNEDHLLSGIKIAVLIFSTDRLRTHQAPLVTEVKRDLILAGGIDVDV